MGPRSANVNDANFRSRGREFDPGLVPYFVEINILILPSIQEKLVRVTREYMHEVLVYHLVKFAQEKVWLC